MTELGFKHIFIPGDVDQPVLLLLHGTGADEKDLVPLAQDVAPMAGILSPLGKVRENGMPRFFLRSPDGVFDQEDLKFRSEELVQFITDARNEYGIGDRKIYALGYSNGANIAASILLRHPDALDGAILLRAMIPFVIDPLPDLSGKPILLAAGIMDPIIPVEQSKQLVTILEQAGAKVNLSLKPTGHGLIQSDINDMKHWLNTAI